MAMTSDREGWIRDNFPEDNMVGFASNQELSFLVSRPDGSEHVYRIFSIKLIFENFPRLTNEYNIRCLPLLKKHFECFHQGLVDSGSTFGKEAVLPCEMRDCDEDEYKKQTEIYHVPPFTRHAYVRKY